MKNKKVASISFNLQNRRYKKIRKWKIIEKRGKKIMENTEKLYKIYYGDNEGDYIRRYLKDDEIINGYLSEAKAFDIFYSSMIMSNNYLRNNYDNLEILLDAYNEEEDYYNDEYQVFIIDIEYNEEITTKATEKMGNTFYFDNVNEIYLTGITDLGTSRTIVSTDIKVEEEKKGV